MIIILSYVFLAFIFNYLIILLYLIDIYFDCSILKIEYLSLSGVFNSVIFLNFNELQCCHLEDWHQVT